MFIRSRTVFPEAGRVAAAGAGDSVGGGGVRAAVLLRGGGRRPGRFLLHLVCERLRKRRRQRASELGSGAEADGECDRAVIGGRGGVMGRDGEKSPWRG